jgi:hypothetical protein
LHTQVPGLFEEGIIGYRGKLRPGQTIQVEVARKDVKLTVRFEVLGKGIISYYDQMIPNMSPRSEVHAHFAKIDQRIPPYACYEPEALRPYIEERCLKYRLRNDIPIPDTTGNEGGAAGGDNGRGQVLPPIIYPTAPIDISEGKVVGGKKGMSGPDGCATDSEEDGKDSDEQKLIQIAQAIHKGQPVIIAIQGKFQGNQVREWEVLFQNYHIGQVPADVMEVFQTALLEILELAKHYGTEGIPGSYLWTQSGISREKLAVSLIKEGKRVVLSFGPNVNDSLRLAQFPVRYRVHLVNNWSASFGSQPTLTNLGLTQFMINITAPWDELANQYRSPWYIFLSAQPWRAEERGEVVVLACNEFRSDRSPNEIKSFVTQCAAQPKTFIDAIRPK